MSRRIKRPASRVVLSVLLACGVAVGIAQTPPPALTAELVDVIEMPRSAGTNGGTVSARINVMLEEPGTERLFVAEHAGPLSIVERWRRSSHN